jgi:hypothetical protein
MTVPCGSCGDRVHRAEGHTREGCVGGGTGACPRPGARKTRILSGVYMFTLRVSLEMSCGLVAWGLVEGGRLKWIHTVVYIY